MGRRLDLQTLLSALLPSGKKAYFQPPANVALVYPCIVYKRDDIQPAFADNSPYRRTTRYMVTVIDQDPDSDIVEQVAALPLCSHNRAFSVDNLNHDIFMLFF